MHAQHVARGHRRDRGERELFHGVPPGAVRSSSTRRRTACIAAEMPRVSASSAVTQRAPSGGGRCSTAKISSVSARWVSVRSTRPSGREPRRSPASARAAPRPRSPARTPRPAAPRARRRVRSRPGGRGAPRRPDAPRPPRGAAAWRSARTFGRGDLRHPSPRRARRSARAAGRAGSVGCSGRHTVAPSSISAWFQSPGALAVRPAPRPAPRAASRARPSPVAPSTPKSRASTRATLPSTSGTARARRRCDATAPDRVPAEARAARAARPRRPGARRRAARRRACAARWRFRARA